MTNMYPQPVPAPVPAQAQSQMPIGPSILPSQNLAAQYAQTFGNVTKNLGQSRSFLSFKGFKFTLKTGGMAQVLMDKLVNQQGIPVDVPRASVDIVLLNMAPHQHCTYYRNAYVEDSNARPDYVWWYGDPLPDEVPREKVEREGVLRNAYQIKHRCIAAFFDASTLQVDFENLFGFDVSSSAVFGDSDQQNTYTLKSLMRLCNLHKTGGQPLTPNTFPIRLTFDRDASVPVINFTPIVNETTGHLYFFPREQQEVIYRLGVSPEALWYIDPVKNTDAFADANVGSEEDEATASGAPAQPQPQQQPQAQAQPQTQRHVVPTPGQAQVVMPAAAPQPSQQYTQPPAAQFTVQATPAPAPQPAPQPMQGQILMPPPPADVPVQQPAAVFGGANQGVVRAAAPQVAQPMPQPVALQVAQHISPQLVAPQAAPAKRTRKSNTKKATPEPATVVEGYDVPQSYTDQLVNDFGEFSEDDII